MSSAALRASLLIVLTCMTACATHGKPAAGEPNPMAESEEQPQQSDGTVVTVRETALHARAAQGAWAIARLPTGTQLTWVGGATANGFSLVVRPTQGPSGWVRSSDLQTVERPVLAGFQVEAACATDLSTCPTRGCAARNTPAAILNQKKRHVPTGDVIATLSFEDFTFLQQEADALVGSGRSDITQEERDKLVDLDVTEGKVSEGDKVKLIAYLPTDSSGPHANSGGESVNCKLTTAQYNDFHIPVSEGPSASEFDSIVVEMIPQRRPAAWTTAALKKVQREGWAVWIEGGLFYDSMHVVNNDPNNPLGGQPKRFSLWEIHPVTKFLVCRQASCDPDDETAWSQL